MNRVTYFTHRERTERILNMERMVETRTRKAFLPVGEACLAIFQQRERERKRDRDRQTDRHRDRHTDRQTVGDGGGGGGGAKHERGQREN